MSEYYNIRRTITKLIAEKQFKAISYRFSDITVGDIIVKHHGYYYVMIDKSKLVPIAFNQGSITETKILEEISIRPY